LSNELSFSRAFNFSLYDFLSFSLHFLVIIFYYFYLVPLFSSSFLFLLLPPCSPSHFPPSCLGHKILNGQKKLELEKGQITEVKMSVQYMSFSAHADAKGNNRISSFIARYFRVQRFGFEIINHEFGYFP